MDEPAAVDERAALVLGPLGVADAAPVGDEVDVRLEDPIGRQEMAVDEVGVVG